MEICCSAQEDSKNGLTLKGILKWFLSLKILGAEEMSKTK